MSNVLSLAPRGVLAVLLAGGEGRGEELHVEEVVLPDGAEHVLDHPLGARAEQVAELRGVRLWGKQNSSTPTSPAAPCYTACTQTTEVTKANNNNKLLKRTCQCSHII